MLHDSISMKFLEKAKVLTGREKQDSYLDGGDNRGWQQALGNFIITDIF